MPSQVFHFTGPARDLEALARTRDHVGEDMWESLWRTYGGWIEGQGGFAATSFGQRREVRRQLLIMFEMFLGVRGPAPSRAYFRALATARP